MHDELLHVSRDMISTIDIFHVSPLFFALTERRKVTRVIEWIVVDSYHINLKGIFEANKKALKEAVYFFPTLPFSLTHSLCIYPCGFSDQFCFFFSMDIIHVVMDYLPLENMLSNGNCFEKKIENKFVIESHVYVYDLLVF